ncbi:MAG: hypothetical protein KA160_07940 [Lacibacter sp.]|nr:hypothetical protein [Lacibacter sp.]
MQRLTNFVIFFCLILLLNSSCRQPKLLLKQTATIDTLHLELDLSLIQQFEYKQALLKKMTKFTEVYNTENHPFKLALNTGIATSNCSIKVMRVKFIGRKENIIGTAISLAGIGTAATLIATGFPVPVGWVYIPSARTSLQPGLSSDISDMATFQRVSINSTGMYRSLDKQIERQSTKVLKYVVSVVQSVEKEYRKNKNIPEPAKQ